MDRAGHWFRGFVYCCLRQCGVVHELREAPRIWPFRGVPDYLGRGGFVLGVANCGIASWGSNFTFLCSSRTRNLKVFVVEPLPFGIIVLFGSSSKRERIAPGPRDTQPSPKS